MHKVVRSHHDQFRNAQLIINADNALVLQNSTNQPPVLLQPAEDLSQLRVLPEGPSQKSLLVTGPSGRGPYRLEASTELEPFGLGCMVYHQPWAATENTATQNLALRLRHEDIEDGHWVAVPEESGAGQSWSIYWVTPLPYNQDDFEEAIPVDLEIVSSI